ncbi:hypothetical protein DEU56DRAFT_933091 [Suillus clintonianus]|uniref:uncharacterized protein n=1 Tax=Suillus clintonianus TaxID=1904413 RepID=UPI001B8810CE|nr:uncharacterized protein DEU56DRAFT_933091 [Suillus clintonianus]KAG2115029.1 hypothetical protein DEU56DRAFT_933091 [Suillus clintonianus]
MENFVDVALSVPPYKIPLLPLLPSSSLTTILSPVTMSTSFSFAVAVDPVIEKLQREFTAIRVRLDGETASIPDESEGLEEERKDWIVRWQTFVKDLSECTGALQAKGIPYTFTPEEVAKGETGNTTCARFVAEVKAADEDRARKSAEEDRARKSAAEALKTPVVEGKPVDEEGQATVRAPRLEKGKGKRTAEDVESEVEDVTDKEIRVKRPPVGRMTPYNPAIGKPSPRHAVRCGKCTLIKRDCYGFPGVSCDSCKKLKVGCTHSKGKGKSKKRRIDTPPSHSFRLPRSFVRARSQLCG